MYAPTIIATWHEWIINVEVATADATYDITEKLDYKPDAETLTGLMREARTLFSSLYPDDDGTPHLYLSIEQGDRYNVIDDEEGEEEGEELGDEADEEASKAKQSVKPCK